MKIKLINPIKENYTPIKQVLYNRGIQEENFNEFINFKYKFNNFSLLKKIDLAIECVSKHLDNRSIIYCIIDPDCDGFTSSAILISYIKKNFPEVEIKYIMHEEKKHGIFLDEIPDDCNLLIAPDCGSENITEHLELAKRNIDVVVLDHHTYNQNLDTPAIVVNSMNNYPNNYLCGAGVVYKFLEALDNKYNLSDSENYIDLCALGLIGDMMKLTNIETLSLINKGLININNGLLKALIKKQSFPMKNEITPTSIAFYIVPLINAVIRSGTMEEKKSVFEAFIDPDKELESTKRGDKNNIELAKDQAIRYMTNAKSRQDKEVTKQKERIENIIHEQNLLDNKILTVIIDFEINKNIVGLIANQLASKYSRPTLILTKGEERLSGSGRNSRYSEIDDLRMSLGDLDITEYAKG